MIHKAFEVTEVDNLPVIVQTTVDNPQGVAWRDAKKQLRQWYLNKAKSLRKITEKEYFGS